MDGAAFVDNSGKLQQSPGGVLAFFAKMISYVLHPLFVPLYITWFLLYWHPTLFSGFSDLEKKQVLVIVALNTIFYPLFSTLLLKGLGFIESIFLRTQKDRIIPYIASGIFFFWTYIVFRKQGQYPQLMVMLMLGIFLASSIALIANIYTKVSMHAIGMGGWLGVFLILFWQGGVVMSAPLTLVILLAGLVGTARLYLNTHQPGEIYLGYLIGLSSQLVAYYVVF